MNADPKTSTLQTGSGPRLTPPRSVDELIAEQGVRPLAQFEDLFGAGRDLWTDEEFEAFLAQVASTRHEES